jgi:hypothetical protein
MTEQSVPKGWRAFCEAEVGRKRWRILPWTSIFRVLKTSKGTRSLFTKKSKRLVAVGRDGAAQGAGQDDAAQQGEMRHADRLRRLDFAVGHVADRTGDGDDLEVEEFHVRPQTRVSRTPAL